MENQRIILFMALAIVILFMWEAWQEKTNPPVQRVVQTQPQSSEVVTPGSDITTAKPVENIAQDTAHAGGGALEGFDCAGMVVGLDFEGDGEAVADVDDPGVFLASTDEDAIRLGREGAQQRLGVLVGAMLAPHD